MSKRNKRRIFLYFILACAIALAYFELSNIKKSQAADTMTACLDARARLEALTFASINPKLGAKAAFVYDFTDKKELDAMNAGTALPLASLTKLMTIRLALKAGNPDDLYTIVPEDLTSEPSIGFTAGDSYPLRELLKATLIASSNNAAVMLADSTGTSNSTFIANMNAEAKALGLITLKYRSVTGLDIADNSVATAWGSAHDIVMLLDQDYSDHPEIMKYGTHTSDTIYSSTGKTIQITNTNKAISKLPLLVASKTGYTDVAGGNLAVLWQDEKSRLLGASVLGSTEDGRFTDMELLHHTAEVYLTSSNYISSFCPSYE
jgi:D-alanyl-D-alanine carboxypeptidase